jgi:hypothetical protein
MILDEPGPSGVAGELVRTGDGRWSATGLGDAPRGGDRLHVRSQADELYEQGILTRRRSLLGWLRERCIEWSRTSSGTERGPTAIGKALGRSSGAVSNALERMVASGYATRTSEGPKKYALAETASAAAR